MAFTSPVERIEAPRVADERTALAAYLDFNRATILHKMDGLGDADLRRAVAPSGLTLLGLLKHLAAVEHWWFSINFAQSGEPMMWSTDEDPDADMRAEPGEATQELVDVYLKMCDRSREIVAAAPSLEERIASQRRGEIDLRWIMLHMLEEYARHNGHADIIRELIDGSSGV